MRATNKSGIHYGRRSCWWGKRMRTTRSAALRDRTRGSHSPPGTDDFSSVEKNVKKGLQFYLGCVIMLLFTVRPGRDDPEQSSAMLRTNVRMKEEPMNKIEAFTNEQLKTEVPAFNIGDTVRIANKIKEGTRERIQMFEGVVIARRNGGISETFTVRRVSYGCGVEKTFPIHSPNVVSVEVIRYGKVRRAKLSYLRNRVGKAAKVKEDI